MTFILPRKAYKSHKKQVNEAKVTSLVLINIAESCIVNYFKQDAEV